MKKHIIRLTAEELETLELALDDWLHENEDSNADYEKIELIHDKIIQAQNVAAAHIEPGN